MLAVHVGACTLLRLPLWESVTGAAWVGGQSTHPKAGPVPDQHLSRAASHHEPVADFDIVDERYAFLRTAPDIVPLAAHEYEGRVHPLLWARERGPSRVVTDLLGHDARSLRLPRPPRADRPRRPLGHPHAMTGPRPEHDRFAANPRGQSVAIMR